MATLSQNKSSRPKTVYARYSAHDGELRVAFYTVSGDQFTLSELTALEHTIAKARNYLQAKLNDQLEANYQTQLEQLTPVPT